MALFVLTAAACGGGSDGDSTETGAAAQEADDPAEETESDDEAPSDPADDADDDAGSADDGGAAASSGQGTATLILGNGESFEFGILCVLDSQESAGSEILFTVVSYDTPYNLDVTQFGPGSFGGAANISVYDSETYDTVWEASTLFGSEVELLLDGSNVTGRGVFLGGGEPGGEETSGELVANC